MNILNNYNDFLMDYLLERVKHNEMTLVISDELKTILDSIEHPIAKEFINSTNKIDFKTKITLLDIDKSDINKLDNISFTLSSKALYNLVYNNGLDKQIDVEGEFTEYQNRLVFDYLKHFRNDEIASGKNRSITSLGKIVNKLFPNMFAPSGEPGEDIESFVNLYKSTVTNSKKFELVNGEDIVYWYNAEQYSNVEGGTLNSSCMRGTECSEYIEFYVANPDKVSLLILKDIIDDTKIRGRALIWNLSEPDNRIFMDRIYYIYESDVNIFKEYAIKNEWLYKHTQNSRNMTNIIDSKTDEIIKVISVKDIKDSEKEMYPYMDTLKYYDRGEYILTNYEKNVNRTDSIFLEDTEGGYETLAYYSEYYEDVIDIGADNIHWCDDINDYRNDDDCFYSYYYRKWIPYEYGLDNGMKCDYYDNDDDFRYDGDYVYLSDGDTATNEYAEKHFKYSEYTGEWIKDYVYSEYSQDYLDSEKDAVNVYLNVEKTKEDWRHHNDKRSWWVWEKDNNRYDYRITEKELEEYNSRIRII